MDLKALIPESIGDFGSSILLAIFIVALLLFAFALFRRRKNKLNIPLGEKDLREEAVDRMKQSHKLRRGDKNKDESNTNYWA